MVKKLSLTDFLAADSLKPSENCRNFILNEDDSLNNKIRYLISLFNPNTLVLIDNRYFTNTITSANNLYFYSINEDTGEIEEEYMILTEAIIDVKSVDAQIYKIISEQQDKSITIRILNEQKII